IGLAPFGATAANSLAVIVDDSHLVHLDLEDFLDRSLDRMLVGVSGDAERQYLAIAPDGLFVLAIANVVGALLFHFERLLGDHRRFEHIPDRFCHNGLLYLLSFSCNALIASFVKTILS